MPATSARAALHQLAALRLQPGDGVAAQRLALLHTLARAALPGAADVLGLHEQLCFLRAYPGDGEVLARAQAMLQGFEQRADLRRHRAALADSGIAGTALRYRFFGGQAQWLAARWPAQLRLDRSSPEVDARLGAALPPLLTPAEADALIELKPGGFAALDRLRGPVTDAAFWLQRLAAAPLPSLVRESISDAVDASYVLDPGPGTPSRTAAFFGPAPLARDLARALPRQGRPELRAELARPPRRVRRLGVEQGQALADLAQAAMVTRARSLEAFSYADARDAWLLDDGDGLAFGFIGMQPERRHVLTASVGGLTFRNGVPIGYLQADILGRSAALSFNTFDSFRGAEAAYTFARWLAALHHRYGTTSFTIEPYQLGHGNDEGLQSGAWWFYFKLGFLPRSAEGRARAAAEQQRLTRRPGARASARTTLALAAEHLCFDLDAAQPWPIPQPAALGLMAGAALGGGPGREAALHRQAQALFTACGIDRGRGLTPDERRAWLALTPVVALLDVERWTADERRALGELMRAKGWRSEREHVLRCIAHPRFERALIARVSAPAAASRPRR